MMHTSDSSTHTLSTEVRLLMLASLVVVLFAASLFWGSVHIPACAVMDILTGHNDADHASWTYIIMDSRLPQAVTATLCGAALSAAGLLLQTAFRNPLAGPNILGIDAGANLGVALVMLLLGGTIVTSNISVGGFALIIVAALIGAGGVMMLLLTFSTILRSDTMLLIAGIMISYLAGSAISLLNYQATEEGVRSYMMWGMGSFASVSIDRLPYFVLTTSVGIVMALLLIKPLNALLLGDNYARNLGIRIRRTRTLLLLTCGLLTASCTAFCGPITFVGLAVPHLARLVLGQSNHRSLLPTTILTGALLALVCNLLTTIPDTSIIPINVITPIIGAPTVIWVILRKR